MNNDLRPITTLPPFKRMCMTIGELPTSYLETMTYYEMLVWFTEYMKNTIIPTINNNGLAVQELQNKYIELKNFVDNYFDNLDVQEEINNKLDDMAEDGSLTNLIKGYVDPIYQAYEEEIEEDINNFKDTTNESINNQNSEISNFKSTINSQIQFIDRKVTSATAGSPKGVYATLQALQTADPDHDYIYVVSADGKWYYYDSNLGGWTEGGTYQSTQIGSNEVGISNLKNEVIEAIDEGIWEFTNFTLEQGGIGNTGNNYDYPDESEALVRVNTKRTPSYLNLVENETYTFNTKDDTYFRYRLYFYNASNVFLSATDYLTEAYKYVANSAEKVRLVVQVVPDARQPEGVTNDTAKSYTSITSNTTINNRIISLENMKNIINNLDNLIAQNFVDFTLEQGGIGSTGNNYDYPDPSQALLRVNTKRTPSYLNLVEGETYLFDTKDDTYFSFRLYFYDSENTYISRTEILTEPYIYTASATEKVRLVVQVVADRRTAEGVTNDVAKSYTSIISRYELLKRINNLEEKDVILLSLINHLSLDNFTNFTLEQGGIGNTGNNYDYPSESELLQRVNTKRTPSYLNLVANQIYIFDTTDHTYFQYRLYFYDDTNTYISRTETLTEPYFYQAKSDEKVRLVVQVVPDRRTEDGVSNDVAKSYMSINIIDNLSDRIKFLDNASKDLFCIMQYNIGTWYNGSGVIIPEEKYDKFYNIQKDIIEKYYPDIMCIEEYNDYMSEDKPANVFLNTYYKNLITCGTNTTYSGKAICTNKNIFDTSNANYVNNDSQTNPRNYLKTYTYMNGRKVCIITTHFALNQPYIDDEIDELLAIVENEEYFIICADTNVEGDSSSIQKFVTAGYKVANLGSYHTTASNKTIDNIITSNNFDFDYKIVDLEKEGLEEGGDHYPFVVYLKIN